MRLIVDRAEIARFVDAVFCRADPDTFVSMRAFFDAKDGVALFEEWSTVRVTGNPDDIVDAAEDLATLCAIDDEPICFAPPICTFRSRDKADVGSLANGLVITVELDNNATEGRVPLEAVLGPPTVTIESGGLWIDPATGELIPKLHLHWRLAGPTRDAVEHDFLLEANRLATQLAGGDPTGVPLVHPLRWAGSWHRKAEPRLAHIVAYNPAIEISWQAALEKLRAATKTEPDDHVLPRRLTDPQQGELLDVAAALAVIPNDDTDVPEGASWKQWSDMGLRIHAATDGSESGYALFVDWSARSAKFDAVKTRKAWAKSHPDRTGAGALFNLAKEHWPGFVRPSEYRLAALRDASLTKFETRPQPPGASDNIEPDPANPKTEPPRGNGHDPKAEAGSASPSVEDDDDDFPGGRTRQAECHWGSAPDFRDPWDTPRPAEWPANVLPAEFHDMLFEICERDGLDPGSQGMAMLAAISGAAPKTARFLPYGMQRRWTVPPILWAAIINRSGHRKTALINNAFQRLQTRQTAAWRIYRREVKEWRELPRKIRLETPKPPEPHSFVVTDTTSEKLQMILAENDRGTLLLRDELAGFFEFGRYSKNSGDAERGFYLESYEANPCTVLRVGNDRRESVYIEVNGLTIFGLIQPARLDDISHRLKLDSDGCCSVLPSFSVSRPQLRG